MEKTCGTCTFMKKRHKVMSDGEVSRVVGECFRMPPTRNNDYGLPTRVSVETTTEACGEYKKGREK